MTFSPTTIAALDAPLNSANVKKNPRGYDYVEGWHAIAEANRIFGHDGWDRELMSLVQVAPAYQTGENWRVAYRATVRITVFGDPAVTRDGTGYGSGITKDMNDAHEGAVKEAETDAMKRALMTFGNPFGLALYDKAKTNVADPVSAACVAGEQMLRAKTDPAEFRTFWETNKDGFKKGLPPKEYAHLVSVMQECAATFRPKDTAA